MRRIFPALFLLLFSSVVFSQEKQVADYIVRNVAIIPMNSDVVLKNKDIIIKDNKIYAIKDHDEKLRIKVRKKINGRGMYVLPGLSDMHVHLPKDSAEVEKFLIMNLLSGITKVRSMRGLPAHVQWKKKYNREGSVYPRLYVSAPPISGRSDIPVTELDSLVQRYKAEGFELIKLLSVKDEVFFDSLNKACIKYNMALAGHFPGNIDDERIFASKINSIEHLGGLTAIPDSLLKERVRRIIDNHIAVCPTLDWYNVSYLQVSLEELDKRRGLHFVDEETAKGWHKKASDYMGAKSAEELRKEIKEGELVMKNRLEVLNYLIQQNAIVLLSPDSSGLFAIPGFNLTEEIKLYQKAGISNYDILKCATVNVARYYQDDSFGTIEEGKEADFILVKENPLSHIDALKDLRGIFHNNNYLDSKSLRKLSRKISSDKKPK